MTTVSPRREGFTGQHLVVLPRTVVRDAQDDRLLRGVMPTAAGYFPQAVGHFVERPHGSDDTILILCVAGQGWFRLGANGKQIEVRAGDGACIPAKTPHAYAADAEHAWTISWVHCIGTELGHHLKLLNLNLQSPTLHVSAGAIDDLGFDSIYRILETGYSHANLLAAASHLRTALAELYRLRAAPTAPGRSADDKIEATMRFMRAHYDRPVRLAQLAASTGLSVPHYSALFRRKTGYSPIDYFLRIRVQRACQLLDTTALKIEQVALRVGYEDPYYFSRSFRRVMHCSPRAYRMIQKG